MLWNYCLAAILDIHNTMISLSAVQGIWVTCACASVFGILLLALDRLVCLIAFALNDEVANQQIQTAEK